MNKKHASILQRSILYLSYTVTIVFFSSVFLSVISISLKTPAGIFEYPPKLIPKPFAWKNYQQVLQQGYLGLYLFNSVKLVSMATFGALLVSIPAAFGFSRFDFRFKKTALMGVLAFQMISPLIVMIPIYRYFNRLGLINTHFAAAITFIAVQIPFTTWLMKGYFDAIPKDIDACAQIDGCSRFQALIKVILPLSTPGIASAIIFNSIQSWSNFIVPFVLLEDTKLYPVSIGIQHFQSTQDEITTNLLAAGSIISILPIMMLFIITQRFIVSLLIEGSVKG